MLAVCGFTIGGLLLLIFGFTLPKDNTGKPAQIIKNYRLAYTLLACAFFGYGLAAITNDSSILALSVIFGNVLIFTATFFIIKILCGDTKYRDSVLWATAVLAAALLLIRVIYFYPTPYMEDSILVFHSQRFVSFMLTSVFLLIWLPVNIRMSDMLTRHSSLAELRKSYILLYTTATFAAVMFLLSKRPTPLVLSFVALSTSFLALTVCNVCITKLGAYHGK